MNFASLLSFGDKTPQLFFLFAGGLKKRGRNEVCMFFGVKLDPAQLSHFLPTQERWWMRTKINKIRKIWFLARANRLKTACWSHDQGLISFDADDGLDLFFSFALCFSLDDLGMVKMEEGKSESWRMDGQRKGQIWLSNKRVKKEEKDCVILIW